MKSTFSMLFHLLAIAALLGGQPLRAADPVVAAEAPAAPVAPTAPAAPDVPMAPEAPVTPKPPRVRVRHSNNEPAVRIHQDFALKAGEKAEDVVVVGGNARIDGTVDGDLVVVFGKVTLGTNAVIKGDFVNVLGGTDLGAGSKVEGDLTAVLSNALLGPDVEVEGRVHVFGGRLEADPTVKYAHRPEVVGFEQWADAIGWLIAYVKEGPGLLRPIAPRLGWVWMVAGGFFLFRLLVTLIARKPVAATALVLAERPLMSLLAGVLTILLIGPMAALLSFTVIGPIALFFAYWIAGIIGTAGVYCLVGQQLGRLTCVDALRNLLLSAIVGTVIIYGAYCVPILGLLVFGIVWLLSIGGAVMAASSAMQDRSAARRAATTAAIAAAAAAAPARTFVPSTAPFEAAASGSEIVPTMQLAGASAGFGSVSGSPSYSTPPAITDAALLILPKAGFWIRMAAAFLDVVLVAMVGGFIGAALGPGVMILLWLAYFIGMVAWKGTTIGGIICGLKVIRTDGTKMTLAVAAVRGLSSVFSVFVFFLGFFWIGWSIEKQGWHDIIAGTYVVKVPRSASLL